MTLKEKLESELFDAMRNKNEERKRTIRMAISNIKLAEIDQKKSLDDQAIIASLYKEVKIRKEKIEDANKGGRVDIAQEAEREIAILQEFLPKMMSEQDLIQAAKSVIQELNAQSMKDMGLVMKTMLERTKGEAPNEAISRVVRELLLNK